MASYIGNSTCYPNIYVQSSLVLIWRLVKYFIKFKVVQYHFCVRFETWNMECKSTLLLYDGKSKTAFHLNSILQPLLVILLTLFPLLQSTCFTEQGPLPWSAGIQFFWRIFWLEQGKMFSGIFSNRATIALNILPWVNVSCLFYCSSLHHLPCTDLID